MVDRYNADAQNTAPKFEFIIIEENIVDDATVNVRANRAEINAIFLVVILHTAL